jgi:transposase
MAKPYSQDFRKKVLEAIQLDGLKKKEASELFHISRNTINLWIQRVEETGDCQAKPTSLPGKGEIITDWDKFRSFVKENQDKTQAEMAELWGNISDRTICRGLKKIRFTRKKKPMAIGNEMKLNEPNL